MNVRTKVFSQYYHDLIISMLKIKSCIYSKLSCESHVINIIISNTNTMLLMISPQSDHKEDQVRHRHETSRLLYVTERGPHC